jgi:hypothetical protein
MFKVMALLLLVVFFGGYNVFPEFWMAYLYPFLAGWCVGGWIGKLWMWRM